MQNSAAAAGRGACRSRPALQRPATPLMAAAQRPVGTRKAQATEQQQQVSFAQAAGPQQGAAAAAAAPPRTLVVALDGEEASFRAIGWTLDHLYRDGDVLHLLHVVPEVANVSQLGAGNLAASLGPEEGLQQKLAKHAEAFAREHCGPLAAARGAQWQLDLVPGRCNVAISDTIIARCNDLDAALVVLSTRRVSFLEGLFMPCISREVAARCRRPTLVYHEA